jgi:hypothetical protein
MRSARGLCGGVPLNSQSSRQTKSGRRTNASEAAWPLQRVGRYTASWVRVSGRCGDSRAAGWRRAKLCALAMYAALQALY